MQHDTHGRPGHRKHAACGLVVTATGGNVQYMPGRAAARNSKLYFYYSLAQIPFELPLGANYDPLASTLHGHLVPSSVLDEDNRR